jgi:YVTN family beta-propeller protein
MTPTNVILSVPAKDLRPNARRQILRGIPLRMTMLAVAFVACVAYPARVRAADPPLRQTTTIPLEGVKGRIDHMAIDPAGKRLFVAALGNNSVEVIDLSAGKVVRHLTAIAEPQGVAYLPDTKTLVVASGQDGKCRFYDGESLELKSAADDLDDADNVRSDGKHVYVGYGSGAGGALGIFDTAGKRAGSVKLAGHPESFQLESATPRVFVNVPSAKLIEVVDRATRTVVARWPVADAEANFPMALDEPNHRLLVACRKPAKLLVYDTETGKPSANIGICGDADDVWLDAPAHRIYVTGGEGSVSVIEQSGADRYREIAKVPTAPGARTSFFDRAARRLYVALPARDGKTAEFRAFEPVPPLKVVP